MATTIKDRPYEINWSKNLIRYVLQTNTPLNTSGLKIEVRLMFKSLTDDLPRMLFTQPLTPDKNGVAYFHVDSILDPLLEHELPSLDSIAPQVIRRQSGQFFIHFREVTEVIPNPAWDESEAASGGQMVIKGGLSYQRWQGPNWFTGYFQTTRPFMTWQESGRLAALDERMFLYFLMPRAAAGQVSMDVKVVYTDRSEDNSVQAVLPGAPTKYSLFALTTGATELALPELTPGKSIWYYEISVTDEDGMLAAPFRYFIDYTQTYNKNRFNYVNSLGGVDSIRVLGEVEAVTKREYETASITPTLAYLDGNKLAPQQFIHAVKLTEEFSGNLGYLKHKAAEYLTDLMASPMVVELRFGRWWPVNITTDKVPVPKKGEELPNIPVDWTYGFVNTQFTPNYVDVGSLPTCPVVGGAAVTDKSETWDTLVWSGSPEHRQYVVEWFLNQPGSSNPQTSGITYVGGLTVNVPHSNHGGVAIIKAVCNLGNRSQGVTVNIGGPI